MRRAACRHLCPPPQGPPPLHPGTHAPSPSLWPHRNPGSRGALSHGRLPSPVPDAPCCTCPGAAGASHSTDTKHQRARGPGGPALRLQHCLRVTALLEGGEKTPSPEKTRPALRQQGRTEDTASLTEGQAALQHHGPRPPHSQGAGGPTCLAGGQAPAQCTSPSVPAPAWEGTARERGVVGSAPRPFLHSASATFSSHVLTSLKPLKSRGVGDLSSLLLRAASPCGQRAPPLAQVNPSTSLNSQDRDGAQSPLTLQAEILNALHHPRASAHTRYHALPGAVHALLRCSLSLDWGVPPAHPQQRNSPGPTPRALAPSPSCLSFVSPPPFLWTLSSPVRDTAVIHPKCFLV